MVCSKSFNVTPSFVILISIGYALQYFIFYFNYDIKFLDF